MTKLSRRTLVAAGLIVTVVAGAATVALWPRPSAQATAEAFAQALAAGDVEALRETGIPISTDAAAAFSAAIEYPQEVEVSTAREDDDTAEVTIDYLLGGESHDAELTARLKDGTWMLDSKGIYGTLRVETTLGEAATVGSVTVDAGEATRLLPALYEVAAAPADLLDGSTVTPVLSNEPDTVTVDTQLGAGAQEAASSELTQYLKACTSETSSIPEACGISIPWGTDFTSLSTVDFHIEQEPTLTLSDGSFVADDGILVARLAGTGLDGAQKTATYRTTQWSVRGSYAFTRTGMTLSVF